VTGFSGVDLVGQAGLEQQYDSFHTQAANLLADDEPLPSGEEIGAQFEQFLARLEEPEE